MEIKRLRNLALEIFKMVNDLNSSFMKSIFLAKLDARVRPNGILVKTCKSATFGVPQKSLANCHKSLATLGPKIWNALPQNIKAENSYKQIPKSSSAKLANRKKKFFLIPCTILCTKILGQLLGQTAEKAELKTFFK